MSATTRTLAQLLAGYPDSPPVAAEQVAQRVAGSGRVLVVLDDDPTGTQSVADLPVLMTWTQDSFGWAFEQGTGAVYVMTNSRSLSPEDAATRNREAARNALAAAQAADLEVSFVSRSDSTLRGHFPLETDVLAQEVAAATGEPVDGVLIVPAFGDAGRVTVGGVHWSGSDDSYVPVGDSEFARDATFGYASSDLRDWVAEKSGGRIPAERVGLVELRTLRTDHAAVVAQLRGCSDGQPVAVDIVEENDLRLLALAVLEAQQAGARLLFRVGPPFARAMIGQPPRPPLQAAELDRIRAGGLAQDAVGGLVVVGSHVDLTSRQLARLRERRDPTYLELDVPRVLDGSDPEHLPALVGQAVDALAEGDVVLATSRALVTGADGHASLDVARRVSTAVTDVVRAVLTERPPRFVVAKGGITSSDVAARGLGIQRAMVRGPMLPGIVSLWEPVDGPARGIPYVVFAGNVGGVDSLAEVVAALSAIPAT